uniref:aminotransferase class I/II-fold pyridoxal phosphate-dependent enzyme n=1 Tax=Empedobacter sp. TaxID=1927715 RepID=UPI0028AA7FCF
MYSDKFQNYLKTQLNDLEEQGLFKKERIIASPQSAEITLENGKTLLNFCANNYLGLSDNKDVISASQKMLDDRGYGMSSVRFICGTQDVHKQLEKKLAVFLGM